MKRLWAIPFVLSFLLGTLDLHAQAIEMSYDTFMKLDDSQRLETFQGLTPSTGRPCFESR
jgi:hypothetical protein